MKQNKIRIGFLDLVGFLAAILQILSFGMQVVYVYLRTTFPIKFSLFSLMFALISAYHKIFIFGTLHLLLFNQNLESWAQLPIQQDPPMNTQDIGSATNWCNFKGWSWWFWMWPRTFYNWILVWNTLCCFKIQRSNLNSVVGKKLNFPRKILAIQTSQRRVIYHILSQHS